MTFPAATATPSVLVPKGARNPQRDLAVVIALAAVALLGLNQPLAAGVTTGTVVVLALCPVWLSTLRDFRFAIPISILSGLSLIWGATLSQFRGDRVFDSSLAVEFGVIFATGIGGLGLLLWARTLIPTYQVALVFGLGYLLRMIEEAPASANAWKYQLSVPIAIILLAVASKAKSAIPTITCLALLGLVSIAADSRSFFGFCLLAAALVLWQRRPTGTGKRMNKLAAVGLMAIVLFGLYSVGTSLLVQGYLGQANQQRTVQQIEDSGSLLIGGRPEWAGTIQLMRLQPMGFGLGTVPEANDVWVAKSGMRAIGTDTENGYVDNYMFGGHFKLHSIIADLWATFGVFGLATGILMAVALIYCLLERLALRTATGLVCLFAVLGVWDLAFGPIFKNLPDVMLALAVTLTVAGGGSLAAKRRDSRGELE